MKNFDKKMGVYISFGFPLCLGLILGLIVFNPSDGFVIWFKSIDWSDPSVGNVGAWVAGVATSLAALATGFAAISSSKAADAAKQAANQWKEQASYEKYIDVGVKARVKLRWLDAHLKNMCEKEFQVFFENRTEINVGYCTNNVDSFLKCLSPNFSCEYIDAYSFFKKYKDSFKYQSDCINNLTPEIFNLIEETFELSKNHVGLSESEKKEIRKKIEELIVQIRTVGCLYERIIESEEIGEGYKKYDIDGCLNCIDSTLHYYRAIRSNLNLITGYIENLVIDSNMDNWVITKKNHIIEEQEIHRLITDVKGGYSEQVINYLSHKFDNL